MTEHHPIHKHCGSGRHALAGKQSGSVVQVESAARVPPAHRLRSAADMETYQVVSTLLFPALPSPPGSLTIKSRGGQRRSLARWGGKHASPSDCTWFAMRELEAAAGAGPLTVGLVRREPLLLRTHPQPLPSAASVTKLTLDG